MRRFNPVLEDTSRSTEKDDAVHILLNFNKAIMTIANTKEECHPKAVFWLPYSHENRLSVYMKLNRLAKIDSQEHFTNLVHGRIVQQVTPKEKV